MFSIEEIKSMYENNLSIATMRNKREEFVSECSFEMYQKQIIKLINNAIYDEGITNKQDIRNYIENYIDEYIFYTL